MSLDTVTGRIKNATNPRKSMLLVEVFNEKQSDKLLKTSLLGSSPIKVERYMSLNSCCGVVRTDFMKGISDEEMQQGFSDQFDQGLPSSCHKDKKTSPTIQGIPLI
jgi:hypothetical protein